MRRFTTALIQDAELAHLPQLQQLIAEQGEAIYHDLLTPEDYVTWLESATSEEAFLKNLQEGFILIALEKENVVGTITISYGEIEWSRIHYADFILKGMYAKYPGAGIGKALIEVALQRVQQDNKKRGILSVAHRNDDAKRFYERHGFRETSCHYFHTHRRWNALTLELPLTGE